MYAQSGVGSFEFIENKGQWDPHIRFMGQLPAGAFFLRQNGFRVLLHNTSDLQRLVHPGILPSTAPQEAAGQLPAASSRQASLANDEGNGGNDTRAVTLHSHAYDVIFEGANPAVTILPDKPLDSYNNYFIGNDPAKWASFVKIYQAVVYKDLYPGIDVRYYSDNGFLKYDIIVHPGADIRQVVMHYVGADRLSINKNQQLLVSTSVQTVKELAPYAFQFDTRTGKQNVDCRYQLTSDNRVRFVVSHRDPHTTLVIDPTLVFSSFTGSPADNWGFTATPGPDGSLFAGGTAHAPGYPTTTGAFQVTFKGGTGGVPRDIAITRFSPNGNARLYSTYIGGDRNEYPHSLICDPQGNLVIMGRTYSNDAAGGYPLKNQAPASIHSTSVDNADIIVTKLNATGSALIGSLRIGGAGNDGVNIEDQQETLNDQAISLLRNYGDDSRSEVVLDAAGNIYVAAQTQSTNFPVIGNSFQKSPGGGLQDGVVLKIDPSCQNLLWSSYLGGSDNDGAFVLALDPANNNIYVGGATASPDFPGNTAGSLQPAFNGAIDGFVTIISNDGTAQLKTTFLGTQNIDVVYGIQFDKNAFPYVMGTTRGSWPVVNATYSNPNSKQFVAKLQPDLSAFVYSTVFGSGSTLPNISPVAFLVDRCENVYISGWGGWLQPTNSQVQDPYNMAGVRGMPITADAFKKTTDNRDFYFIVIKKNASGLLYGSYFGQDGGLGEHVDGGTSRFDQQGVIYQAICANCGGGAAFPTTPGVVGPVNGTRGQGCNLAAVKIAFNFAGVAAGPRAYFNGVPDSSGCVPFSVILRDTVRNAQSYSWHFDDGSPDSATTSFELPHTFNAVGVYHVRLIAIDSNTCNIRDTAYLNIYVRNDKANLAFVATKLPPCQSLSYQFDNTSVPPAGKPFGALSFIWDFGDGARVTAGPGSVTHAFAAPGTYIVRLILTDTAYCNAPDSIAQTLRIAPLVKAQFETPPAGCAPYSALFNNTSLAGQQFFWDFGDGTTSNDVSPVHDYPNTGAYTVRLVVIDSATCNIIDSTAQTINVYPRPTADFTFTPVPPLENTPTVFYNASTGGTHYKWLFGDGDSTLKNNMDTVLHQYNASGTYQACLITYNQFECTDTACKNVQAIVVPLLDVPNAFTPGRFGKNAIVRVEGFGIAKMTWKIYNRWGQLVFQSHDRNTGWDGTFKGQPQPMDVYAYTLDVEFFDGSKTSKTGDITLIR